MGKEDKLAADPRIRGCYAAAAAIVRGVQCENNASMVRRGLGEFCCTAVSCVGFQKGSLLRALSHETLDLYRISLPPRHRA